MHTPGLKLVIPSTPYDAKGLLKTAILDMETIYESVKKTGRVLIVHEAVLTCGPGAEIAARISEEAFDYLDAPVKRLATKDVPIPMAPVLEDFVIPQKEDIKMAVKDLAKV